MAIEQVAGAVVAVEDDRLREPEQDGRGERIEIAVAIEVGEFRGGDRGALVAHKRRADADRVGHRERAFGESEDLQSPVADRRHDEFRSPVAVEIARMGLLRVAERAVLAADRALVGNRRQAAGDSERRNRTGPVVDCGEILVAVGVEVGERQIARLALERREGGRGERAAAEAPEQDELSQLRAAREQEVGDAVAVHIVHHPVVGRDADLDRFGRQEGAAGRGLQDVEKPVHRAAGNRKIGEAVAIEIARDERRRDVFGRQDDRDRRIEGDLPMGEGAAQDDRDGRAGQPTMV